MSSNRPVLLLPPEIILRTINFVLPFSAHATIALPPSHTATKTLLSLSYSSRVTHSFANPLLYRHCLYIDTISGTKRLNEALKTIPNHPQLLVNYQITSLYLSLDIESFSTSAYTNNGFKYCHIPSLLKSLQGTLSRFILDVPLWKLWLNDDCLGFREQLRDAFERLTSLEIFCSVQENLDLTANNDEQDSELLAGTVALEETPVWSMWPKLKVLALFGGNPIMSYLAKLQHIETVIITRPEELEIHDNFDSIDRFWRRCAANEQRGLDIIVINTEGGHQNSNFVSRFRDKNGRGIAVKGFDVLTSYYGDEDDDEACQTWIKRNMLSGQQFELWD